MSPALPVDPGLLARQAVSGRGDRMAATLGGAKQLDPERIRETAEDFEAMFVAQMLTPMFAELRTDGVLGGGHGEDVFRSLLIEEYGKIVVRSGGIGVADAIQRQLLSLQESP